MRHNVTVDLLYYLFRIIQDYVLREDGYTLTPATTSVQAHKVTCSYILPPFVCLFVCRVAVKVMGAFS